jgi:hypothetical protein
MKETTIISRSEIESPLPTKGQVNANQAEVNPAENNQLDTIDYCRILGNIYIGWEGGVIGNNFPNPDNTGKIPANEIRSTIVCRTDECLKSLANKLKQQLQGD